MSAWATGLCPQLELSVAQVPGSASQRARATAARSLSPLPALEMNWSTGSHGGADWDGSDCQAGGWRSSESARVALPGLQRPAPAGRPAGGRTAGSPAAGRSKQAVGLLLTPSQDSDFQLEVQIPSGQESDLNTPRPLRPGPAAAPSRIERHSIWSFVGSDREGHSRDLMRFARCPPCLLSLRHSRCSIHLDHRICAAKFMQPMSLQCGLTVHSKSQCEQQAPPASPWLPRAEEGGGGTGDR